MIVLPTLHIHQHATRSTGISTAPLEHHLGLPAGFLLLSAAVVVTAALLVQLKLPAWPAVTMAVTEHTSGLPVQS